MTPAAAHTLYILLYSSSLSSIEPVISLVPFAVYNVIISHIMHSLYFFLFTESQVTKVGDFAIYTQYTTRSNPASILLFSIYLFPSPGVCILIGFIKIFSSYSPHH